MALKAQEAASNTWFKVSGATSWLVKERGLQRWRIISLMGYVVGAVFISRKALSQELSGLPFSIC
jgi:hypothetical protein